MPHTLREIAKHVSGTVLAGGDLRVSGVARIDTVEAGELTYVTTKRHLEQAEQSPAAALLLPPGMSSSKPAVEVHNPLLAYARLLTWFYPPPERLPAIDAEAWIDDTAQVNSTATILPFAYVGPHAVVEENCFIGAGVSVGASVQLGAGTIVHPNVTLYPQVHVGNNVTIHAGSVIGSDGFGYVVDDEGRQVKIPQLGRVVIEDDVEIGANVCIDRATQGETRIGRGTKIDNQVHIGHNVVIGSDSIIVAQVGISGSCRLGSHVVLAGQVGVRDHVTIGDGAMVAGGTGVVRDLEPGARVAGYPAIPHQEWLRAQALVAKLPDWSRRVQRLERRLAELEHQGDARESSDHS